MEQRNEFPVLSTTAVLRVGKCVVVDWQALWIGGASIVVLDSVSECPACGNDGLARLRNRSHDCPAADGSVRRRAAVAGFHPAKCVLLNEQRRALAALLRRVVPLHFAMVANERAKLFARSAHRSGGRSYVPDQAVQLAAGRSRAHSDRCKIHYDHFTKP